MAQAAELGKRPPEPPHRCTARNGSGNVWRELLRIVHPDIYGDVGLFVWCAALHEGGCSFGHSLIGCTGDSTASEGSLVDVADTVDAERERLISKRAQSLLTEGAACRTFT